MNRANQFAMSLPYWFFLAGVLFIYIIFTQPGWGRYIYLHYRIIVVKWKAVLAMLKLRQQQLSEEVTIRYLGFRSGILIRETTVGLAYKVTTYLWIRTLNLLLQ
jgi:hypothetical protein